MVLSHLPLCKIQNIHSFKFIAYFIANSKIEELQPSSIDEYSDALNTMLPSAVQEVRRSNLYGRRHVSVSEVDFLVAVLDVGTIFEVKFQRVRAQNMLF